VRKLKRKENQMREKEESEGWVGWVLGHGLEFFIFYFLKMFGRFGRVPEKNKENHHPPKCENFKFSIRIHPNGCS
jgi:hypothetical protein